MFGIQYTRDPADDIVLDDPRWEAPSLLIPGRKPVGPSVLARPELFCDGFYFLCHPSTDHTMGDVKDNLVGRYNAAGNSLTYGTTSSGIGLLLDSGGSELGTGPVSEFLNNAFTTWSWAIEFISIPSSSSDRIVKLGGDANGIADIERRSGALEIKVVVNRAGGDTTYETTSDIAADYQLMRAGFVCDGTNGTLWVKNVATGQEDSITQACGSVPSNTSGIQFGDTTGTTILHSLFVTKTPFPQALMRDIVFRDPYQLLIPA